METTSVMVHGADVGQDNIADVGYAEGYNAALTQGPHRLVCKNGAMFNEDANEEAAEEVVVAEDPEPEKPPARKKAKTYRIVNRNQAGQAVHGMEGYAEFDEDGVAVVSEIDYEHFLKVPGYSEAK